MCMLPCSNLAQGNKVSFSCRVVAVGAKNTQSNIIYLFGDVS
jgi:hypothetical protein